MNVQTGIDGAVAIYRSQIDDQKAIVKRESPTKLQRMDINSAGKFHSTKPLHASPKKQSRNSQIKVIPLSPEVEKVVIDIQVQGSMLDPPTSSEDEAPS